MRRLAVRLDSRPALIPTVEAARLAGVTYRQIDYWRAAGEVNVFDERGQPQGPKPGSGSRSYVTPETIDVLRRLGAVTRITRNRSSSDIMATLDRIAPGWYERLEAAEAYPATPL